MTLKEKFECIDHNEMGIDVQNCIKITEDFAIGFAEWYYKLSIKECHEKTSNELLEIYKKEKGL
jgi:hypothetical protein